MKKHYADHCDIDVTEIADLPLFNENLVKTPPKPVIEIGEKIANSDGIIIGTPEYDHAVPAALKSCLEWMSSAMHAFRDKPVMIVGGSYGLQGTVRAQINLRDILDSPGVQAKVLPGHEFMLPHANQAFDKDGNLINKKTVQFIDECMKAYMEFVHALRV